MGTKSYINGPGHMNKMAVMHINSKQKASLKIFFSRNRMPMIFLNFETHVLGCLVNEHVCLKMPELRRVHIPRAVLKINYLRHT